MSNYLQEPLRAQDPSPINPDPGADAEHDPWTEEPVGPDGLIERPDGITDNPDVIGGDTPLVPS
ncbi:hypothetical protein IQ22_00333 [Pseudomonas duriflava]|uniref:Uncharacterized protein n=1 Tax=Pseudomonas duriflava TaxID=459528 RepID=A0A562QPJ7_9PSED|nr:hypothetical protein [Pseudomonas duriflava]TWI58625.1 hypothetical protein IQ22_00333 [Pseudomonas duriflava]